MRNYWLRIAFGALGIFALGMFIWSMVLKGKHRIKEVVESAEPITIPLALIPFKVDGQSLGTLREVRIIRSDPEKVKAVDFRVRLADSVSDGRLTQCVLVVGGSLEKIDAQHAFSCVAPADTVGGDLAPVGEVRTQRGETYVLFAKAGALDSVKFDFGRHREVADSIREAQQDFADSIRDAGRARADSIREAAQAMSDSIRAHVDSVIRAAQPDIEQAKRMKVKTGVTVTETPAPPAAPKR